MQAQAHDLFETYPEECARYGDGPNDLWPLLCDFIDEVRAAGIEDAELRARCLLLAFVVYPHPWPAFVQQPFWAELRRKPARAEDLFRDYCALVKYGSKRSGDRILVWW